MSYWREQIQPSENARDAQHARPESPGAALLRNMRLERHLRGIVTDRDRALVLGCVDCGRITARTGPSGALQCERCARAMSRAALRKGKR